MSFHAQLMVLAENSPPSGSMLPYVLMVVGGIIIAGPAFMLWRNKVASRWMSVEGKVISSTVELCDEYEPVVLSVTTFLQNGVDVFGEIDLRVRSFSFFCGLRWRRLRLWTVGRKIGPE